MVGDGNAVDGNAVDGRTLRVMVVDDHPIWRDAVARDLAEDGFEVVATADGVGAARRRAAVVLPDVVLMDMQLADGDGAVATAQVLEVSPGSRVLVLSASAEQDHVLQAVKAGATGYLVKSASKAELAEAVRATAVGRAVFTPGLAGLVLGEYRRIAKDSTAGPAVPSLTERETEVLRHVAKGLTAKQIAAKLSVSHRTVENHVQATFRKLHVANRVELARYAIEHGLDTEIE
jgi:DNA-binding NarL/FixJ family response regulator